MQGDNGHFILDRSIGQDFLVQTSLFMHAKVAELADALDLGSSEVKLVGVRVPSFAPI